MGSLAECTISSAMTFFPIVLDFCTVAVTLIPIVTVYPLYLASGHCQLYWVMMHPAYSQGSCSKTAVLIIFLLYKYSVYTLLVLCVLLSVVTKLVSITCENNCGRIRESQTSKIPMVHQHAFLSWYHLVPHCL